MKKGRGGGAKAARGPKAGGGSHGGASARGGAPGLAGSPALDAVAGILLTVLALVLQARCLLQAGPLWRDEVNSVEFARMASLSEIARNLRYDGFPLLSTLVLRGWMALGLGAGDFGLRVYGFLIAAAFLAALWWTCRRLGCRAPLLSLALVGMSPWAIFTISSVRPYGLGLVFLVLTIGAIWAAMERSSPKRWLAAGALAVLSVQCMYQNAILLFGIGLAAIVTALAAGRRWAALTIVGIGLAASLSVLPYASAILAARDWNVVIQTPVSWAQILGTFRLALGAGASLAEWPWIAAALAVLFLWYRSLGGKPRGVSTQAPTVTVFATALLVLGSAVFLLALKSTHLPTEPWYYVPLLVAVVPALDAAIAASLPSGTPRLAWPALAIVLALSGSASAWPRLAERRTNLDRVAAHLASHAVEGDVVIVSPSYYGVSFRRYYKGAARWMVLPPAAETRIHRYDLIKDAMTRPDAVEPALHAMSDALASGHRVWLVGGLPDPGSSGGVAPPVAPTGPMGWYCGPYLVAWGRQASYMLSQHAIKGEPVSVPLSAHVNPYENVPMVVVSGWK